ncbi:MAG: hypothetical protein AAB502_07625 [Chloroflexota bacterium]
MLKQYVVDPANMPWKNGDTEGVTFRGQVLLSGEDGGPEAFRFKFDPSIKVYAHMHLTSQFQVLLGGMMDLPKETMKMRPVGVLYTDHNVPYGPFSVGGDHHVLVLHPRRAGLVTMGNRDARKMINLTGRQIPGMEKDTEWLPIPGHEGARCKFLIPSLAGPEALMLECPPNMAIPVGAPLYGRYEVVLKGAVVIEGRSLGPPGLRYVEGDEQPSLLTAGPEGATVMFFSFDKDAREGGLTGDALSMLGAEAMAKAI